MSEMMVYHSVQSILFLGFFYGGTLTTNHWPLAVSVVCPLGLLVNNFMLDWTTSLSVMYFSVSFDGFIVTISVDKSTRSRLDVSASLGLLQYWCVLIHYCWYTYYIYSL